MVKKKQPDFQPTKLRVGKHLPKGRNVTNTSFKSKKIITRDQKLKPNTRELPLADLLRLARQTNVFTKIDALKRIGKFADHNIYSLASDFSDILKTVGGILLEDHSDVRKEAIDLIKICLETLSDTQMTCFMTKLTSNLYCMMTHIHNSVRRDSLLLLSIMLKTHPCLVCHHTKMLHHLLNMISSKTHQRSGSKSKAQAKRKLDDTITNNMTSVEWRDQVLQLIVEFLQKLIEDFSKDKKNNEDEQKVYWDGKRPLYVPLYAGSGLAPKKLEIYSPGQMKSETKINVELKSFLNDLLPLSSGIITEEIASTLVSAGCNILHGDHIQRLNTVTKVLCGLAEWFELGGGIDKSEDSEFLSLLNDVICKKLMKRFPYTQQDSWKSNEVECVHLNLGICYLYNTFLLGTKYFEMDMEDEIIIYLCTVFTRLNTMDIKSAYLILQNSKSVIHFISTSEELRTKYEGQISRILDDLCSSIGKFRDTDTGKLIKLFFIELSLDFDYNFLLSYGGMQKWIQHLFHEMKCMKMYKKADLKLLKCINQICCREYPTFMDELNKANPKEILDYMKLDIEDYQFTVMNLITHMTNLPSDFLQDVAELILCDEYLSTKTTVKFIRLLYHRFLDPRVRELEFIAFIKFLINVACDIIAIDTAGEDMDAMNHIIIEDARTINEMEISCQQGEGECEMLNNQSKDLSQESKVLHEMHGIKSLLLDVQDICLCPIIPSVSWERHSDIFEVCLECLLLYPNLEIISQCTSGFIITLSNTKLILPVHSAIAFTKLIDKILRFEGYGYQDNTIPMFSYELMISSLLYISLMTSKVPKEKLKSLGIVELQSALNLTRDHVPPFLNELTNKMYDQGLDEPKCLHILRIIKFFISKKYVFENDLMNFIPILQAIESFCPENSPQRAVLYDIYEFIES